MCDRERDTQKKKREINLENLRKKNCARPRIKLNSGTENYTFLDGLKSLVVLEHETLSKSRQTGTTNCS